MTSADSLKAQYLIEHLILQNAIEIDGFDNDTGEMIYSITDKLEFVNPDLFNSLKGDFEKHMFTMIDQGPKVMKWKLDSRFYNG